MSQRYVREGSKGIIVERKQFSLFDHDLAIIIEFKDQTNLK